MGKPDFKKIMEEGGSIKGFAWPETCGDFDIKITKDGVWFYRGSPIGRKSLVKLFATVLQKDDAGEYWLVTPAERGRVAVEDAPFLAVEMRVEAEATADQILHFRTNLDHWVCLDEAHPLRVAINPKTQEPAPYIMLWDRLEAKLTRAIFYQLVDLALSQQQSASNDADETLAITSAHTAFKIV
ncbi:MAG: DUF1285 domain-containing protein [Alphaproteobacteria bacterium]